MIRRRRARKPAVRRTITPWAALYPRSRQELRHGTVSSECHGKAYCGRDLSSRVWNSASVPTDHGRANKNAARWRGPNQSYARPSHCPPAVNDRPSKPGRASQKTATYQDAMPSFAAMVVCNATLLLSKLLRRVPCPQRPKCPERRYLKARTPK